MLNPEFNKLLSQRGLNGQKLADLILCGRAHLMQVLGGTRGGAHTWKRLARALTKDEYELAFSFACERRIVSAALEGGRHQAAHPRWVFRDKAGAVVPLPSRWETQTMTEEAFEEFLRGKKIEVLRKSVVYQ